MICKPNSVSRRIGTTAIYLLTASRLKLSELPGNRMERAIPFPCLLLLRVGFTQLPLLPAERCALTLIPLNCRTHLFTLGPLPPKRNGSVSFLWHFPSSRRIGMIPCYGTPCPAEFGLSSPTKSGRLSDQLQKSSSS